MPDDRTCDSADGEQLFRVDEVRSGKLTNRAGKGAVVATSALLMVEIERQPGCSLLTIRGELDLSSAPVLTAHVDQLLETGGARVVLDVDGLTFCDSVGLRALVLAANRAVDRGGWLRLAAPQQGFTSLLSVVSLLSTLPTYRSVPAAVDGDPAERILA